MSRVLTQGVFYHARRVNQKLVRKTLKVPGNYGSSDMPVGIVAGGHRHRKHPQSQPRLLRARASTMSKWAVHSIMWLVIRCAHVAKAAIVCRAKQGLALEAPLSMTRSTDSCAGNGAEFATVS